MTSDESSVEGGAPHTSGLDHQTSREANCCPTNWAMLLPYQHAQMGHVMLTNSIVGVVRISRALPMDLITDCTVVSTLRRS